MKKSVRIRQERLQREQERERAAEKTAAEVPPNEALRDRESAFRWWIGERFENVT